MSFTVRQVKPDQEARAQKAVQLSGGQNGHCHTAVEGESCYQDVQWTMTVGMKNHSNWYGGCPKLTPKSTVEEFQACLFKINSTTCPLPCNPTELIPETVVNQTRSD